MDCKDTLRIRNFPNAISDDDKEDFLKHFGAIAVKIITSKVKLKCVVFAKFETPQHAKAVMVRLHQIKILDSILCVEYAVHEFGPSKIQLKVSKDNEINSHKHFNAFVTKLNGFNSSVGFNQPPPGHLSYDYPKPNRGTINNIAHALASIPKFYTQVLHLMNRMNLPPPFSELPDTPQITQPVQTPFQFVVEKKKESSESEIESDPESDKYKEIIPMKRTLPQKKVVKRPKFVKPIQTVQPTVPAMKEKDITDDIFDRTDLQQRKIELIVTSECLENKVEVVAEKVGTFGIINPPEKELVIEEVIEKEVAISNKIITDEELNANRIPFKDLNVLQVFKNYHPGPPSSRLYIKNIAKTVNVDDIEYIYKKYMVEVNDGASQFDIRLMKEGRMKGQAFITLDSVETAQKAVKETNGFILKDKPLVVVFARSAIPKK